MVAPEPARFIPDPAPPNPIQESDVLYEIAKPPVRTVMQAIWKPTISGTEHIPAGGPVILASNHLSYADTVILPAQIRRTVHFLGKSDIFTGRSPLNPLVASIMRGLHVMPVDRSGGNASRTAIEAGLSVLRDQKILGIYPEGTRSPDGRLHRGKTGVARFALATGAPIVPAAVIGAFEAHCGRRYLPRRAPRISVVLGEPIRLEALDLSDREEALVLRELTDLVMARIQQLSGQEYHDEYAADVKKRLRAEG